MSYSGGGAVRLGHPRPSRVVGAVFGVYRAGRAAYLVSRIRHHLFKSYDVWSNSFQLYPIIRLLYLILNRLRTLLVETLALLIKYWGNDTPRVKNKLNGQNPASPHRKHLLTLNWWSGGCMVAYRKVTCERRCTISSVNSIMRCGMRLWAIIWHVMVWKWNICYEMRRWNNYTYLYKSDIMIWYFWYDLIYGI